MTETPIEEFYGYLGRVEATPEHATLRVYPFGFSSNEAAPVFEVFVDHPDFSAEDLKPFFDGEIEVMVYPDCVQIDEVLESIASRTLTGKSITAARRPYDLRDYAERVSVLDIYNAEQSAELRAARFKLGRMKSVAVELIRRAEKKAHVSREHGLRQAGAIEALQRMLAELEQHD